MAMAPPLTLTLSASAPSFFADTNDSGEGFVQLQQIQIGGVDALLLTSLDDGVGGLLLQ